MNIFLFHKIYSQNFGFNTWCKLLTRSLKIIGHNVFENDYDFISKNKYYPIGLLGQADLIENWKLSNPALINPCAYWHPSQNPTLFTNPNFKYCIVSCKWLYEVFSRVYGKDRCLLWFAGIFIEDWTFPNRRKTIDVLIYDKENTQEKTISPFIERFIKSKKLSYKVIKYGTYKEDEYKQLLARSKCMFFLSKSETQGLAYNFAMASNVPIIAWDCKETIDINSYFQIDKDIQITSTPYFSSECGVKFTQSTLKEKFEEFWNNLSNFNPRKYVMENLSPQKSAELYIQYYLQISQE
ncbi:MAG: hypothetical protein AB1567_04305 [bacterium]